MNVDEKHRPPLTEDAVERARELVGVLLRRRGLNTSATAQNIRRWAVSIGERNPLFLDVGYGMASRYGVMIAPPLWLYSVDDTVIAPRMPGVHTFYAGADWEFDRPVRLGDAITAAARLTGVEESESRFAGRKVTQTGEVRYAARDGSGIARVRSRVDRFSRRDAADRGLYADVTKHKYGPEDLLDIEEAYDAEVIRGDAVRYWEDVQIGEQLTPVVKGPLTSEDLITFVTATQPVRTYGSALRYRRRHPLAEFYDQETGRYDAWERALLDPEVAQLFGLPLPHDLGYQRICWTGNLLTNWMGDDGQLKRLRMDIVRPNFYGDTTFCRGSVADKLERDGLHLIVCDVWCENQRGERTATGRAEVALQSRSLDH